MTANPPERRATGCWHRKSLTGIWESEMLKAIIFDFDYTLGDSTDGIVLSVNYALEKLGLSKKDREDIKKTIGLSLKDTYFALTAKTDVTEAEKFSKYFVEKADLIMVENTVIYDGVKEILRELKSSGYKIGIVTTKYRYRIEKILNRFQATDLVDLIVGSDDVKIEKPNPEGLLWAIDTLQLEKSEALYVGDSVVDAKTAENAQVDFAGVLTGTTTQSDFAKYKNVFVGENMQAVYSYIRSF
jgi:phosphoglycolate phosphatase